jgi:hypothetical protein
VGPLDERANPSESKEIVSERCTDWDTHKHLTRETQSGLGTDTHTISITGCCHHRAGNYGVHERPEGGTADLEML